MHRASFGVISSRGCCFHCLHWKPVLEQYDQNSTCFISNSSPTSYRIISIPLMLEKDWPSLFSTQIQGHLLSKNAMISWHILLPSKLLQSPGNAKEKRAHVIFSIDWSASLQFLNIKTCGLSFQCDTVYPKENKIRKMIGSPKIPPPNPPNFLFG